MSSVLTFFRICRNYRVPKDIRLILFNLVYWTPFYSFLQKRFVNFKINSRKLITDPNQLEGMVLACTDSFGWKITFTVGNSHVKTLILTPALISITRISISKYYSEPIDIPYIIYCCSIYRDMDKTILTPLGIQEWKIESNILINTDPLDTCVGCTKKIDQFPILCTEYKWVRDVCHYEVILLRPHCTYNCFSFPTSLVRSYLN